MLNEIKRIQDRAVEIGIPTFFEFLLEAAESIRLTHPLVEQYSIPKLLLLSKISDKNRKRSYVDEHFLLQYMNNVINSNKDNINENVKNYKKLIKDYNNGQ